MFRNIGSYQKPPTDELSWGAVRKHMEEIANQDWKWQSRHLSNGGFFTKIKNSLQKPTSKPMLSGLKFDRPGLTPKPTVKRPGFIKD